jgi:hypothetical protein
MLLQSGPELIATGMRTYPHDTLGSMSDLALLKEQVDPVLGDALGRKRK